MNRKIINIYKKVTVVLFALITCAYLVHFNVIPLNIHITSIYQKLIVALMSFFVGRYICIGFCIKITKESYNHLLLLIILAGIYYLPITGTLLKEIISIISQTFIPAFILGIFLRKRNNPKKDSAKKRVKKPIIPPIKQTKEEMLAELVNNKEDITDYKLSAYKTSLVKLLLHYNINVKYVKAEILEDHIIYNLFLTDEIEDSDLEIIKIYINQYFEVAPNKENKKTLTIVIPYRSMIKENTHENNR